MYNPQRKRLITSPSNRLQTSHKIQEGYLKSQLLRLKAIQKLRFASQIWHLTQQQLCKVFLNYHLMPYNTFTKQQLLEVSDLKLVKNQNRIYFGQISGKKKKGMGIMLNKEGKVYQGHFDDGQKKGHGVQVYPNGNVYVGTFNNSKKHGLGTFFWFNIQNKNSNPQNNQIVQYYQGGWWGGLPDGKGIHQKISGDVYRGIFKNGLKHGQGKEQFCNGDVYVGQYVNGLPQGYGDYYWIDGSSYKGDMKQGLRNGYGVWKMGSGSRQNYKGHYSLDKKQGYGVYQWDNGWIYKGNFHEDLRHGYGQLYNGSTLVFRGLWEQGQQKQEQKHPQTQSRQLEVIQQSLPKIIKRKPNQGRFSSSLVRSRSVTQQSQPKRLRSSSSKKLLLKKTPQNKKTVFLVPKYETKSRPKNHINPRPNFSNPQSFANSVSIRKCKKINCGCNNHRQLSGLSSAKNSKSTFKLKSKSPKSLLWRYEI